MRQNPKAAIFLCNYGCNIQCQFCLNTWKSEKHIQPTFINKKDQLNIITKLKDAGIQLLTFSGGEPLMNPWMTELIDHAFMLGMTIIIQTNGHFITKELLMQVKGKIAAFEISLEGPEEIHNLITRGNNYQKTINGITLAKAHGCTVLTNFTITKLNMGSLEEYLNILASLHVDMANFTRLYLTGAAKIHKESLLPSHEAYTNFFKKLTTIKTPVNINLQSPTPELQDHACTECAAAKNEITVYPNGDVSLCPGWPATFANLNATDFTKIWNSPMFNYIASKNNGTTCLLNEMIMHKL